MASGISNIVSLLVEIGHHINPIFTCQDWKKEVKLKCSLKPQTYYQYLDDIVKMWPCSMEAFSILLDIFNTNEPPIKIKSSVSIRIPTIAKHY